MPRITPISLGGSGPLAWARRDRRRVILVDRQGSVQSTLRIGHRAPERATPDYVPMTLAATVLGGAFTSRLHHLIREGTRTQAGLVILASNGLKICAALQRRQQDQQQSQLPPPSAAEQPG